MRSPGRRCDRLVAFLVMELLAPGSVPSTAGRQAPTEYEVKAAYLFHFASFVEWPEGTFEGRGNGFVVGVLGEDPFDGLLEETFSGKNVLERPLRIKRGARFEDLGRPHILFISSSEAARLPHILAALDDASVLTVGDTPGFAARGGIINFTIRDHHVRFEVNLEKAKRAHLKISSQLLKLATIVQAE